MTWRTVVLTKDSKISLRLKHLVVQNEETVTIPLAEIGQLIIENPNIVMTGHIINALSKHKITTIICNEQHMPYSNINLIYGHFRQPQNIQKQINWSTEKKGYLWTEIIKEKINNQKLALQSCLHDVDLTLLESYINEIEFKDKTNREGHAAKVYFNQLFGMQFIRGIDNPVNWGLNYGYSLLLSAFTKVIVTKGLLTEIGIHHSNQFNQYNLASDLMEVYRPLVDVIVKKNINDTFCRSEKNKLLNIFNQKISIRDKKQYLTNSIELYVDSLIKYLNEGDETKILFPVLDF